jgi:hypothetical protein
MISQKSEFIWHGALHLGDEPGIYGNASYVGLCTELPVTIRAFPKEDGSEGPHGQVTFVVYTKQVTVYQGYPGHKLTAFLYDPGSQFHWNRREVATAKITDTKTEVTIDLAQEKATQPAYLSLRIEVDRSDSRTLR